MFRGVDLISSESIIISDNKAQEFDGDNKGGGLDIVLRVRLSRKEARNKPKNLRIQYYPDGH